MLARHTSLLSAARRSAKAECSLHARRSFVVSAVHAKAPTKPAAQQHAEATSSAASSAAASKGTVLTGINIYKDRADPVALPDSAYPSWLWTLLDEGKETTDGVKLESTDGMTKGEARAAEKRNLRAIRAAHRAKERLAQLHQAASAAGGSGAGMQAVGTASQGVFAESTGEAETIAGDAAAKIADPLAYDREKKRELRKANRASIKAKNFLKSQ